MPVQAVAMGTEIREQRVFLIFTVCLGINNRLILPDRFFCALQDLKLHAFHVDFQEVAARKVKGINGDGLHRFSLSGVFKFHSAPVVNPVHIKHGNRDCALTAPYKAFLQAMDVREAVKRNVSGKELKDEPLRLKRPNLSLIACKLRQMDCMGADIGARFNHDMARLDDLLENIRFALTVFPVKP